MSRKGFDDLLEQQTKSVVYASDEADAAFWDEFYTKESNLADDQHLYTITIQDEQTGEKKIIKHVRLSSLKSKRLT